MFWKKTYKIEKDLGRFEWILDHWLSDETDDGVVLSVAGTNDSFDELSLSQLKDLLLLRKSLVDEALEFLQKEDISHFAEIEKLYLSCISSTRKTGKFDIEFSVTDWEDGYVLVHFEQNKPFAISLGD